MPIVLAGPSSLSMRGGWRRGLRIMEPEGADLSEPLRSRDGQGPIGCKNGRRSVARVSTDR
jgi:hypothetical protein